MSGPSSGRDPSEAGCGRADPGQQAFALWLERGLRRLFGSVIDEPIPDDLMRLIDHPADPGSGEPDGEAGGPVHPDPPVR
ncbi:hypothetical protein HLH36_06215 [Gluconacetobacter aggeris]|uniref:Anti-sigma factor NepR domain-containing protein n=1 Tax=Gluconacetobacter aggeris TaxID=1286186 RepID=A0A7W4NXV9_9PROT|nr:NepR family anti-sigma factor [Gluconacetobacter aggeris]MBB2167953.1 hypothetical protein [Gluconacetobacter aggeris]